MQVSIWKKCTHVITVTADTCKYMVTGILCVYMYEREVVC